MKYRWIILLGTAILAGLWWDLGSTTGMVFCAYIRPVVLGLLPSVLWRPCPWHRLLVPLITAVILTEGVSTLTYAIQAGSWYITSDAETQIGLIIALLWQLFVATTTLVLVQRIRKTANNPAHATGKPAPDR